MKPTKSRPAAKKGIIVDEQGSDLKLDLYDDGSIRRRTPKVKGKAAVKAAKRARMKARLAAGRKVVSV